MVSEDGAKSAGEGLRCVYCGGERLEQTHAGLHHPLRPQHGPFDFYRCESCGSGLTLPPPSLASLAALYASFDEGLPEFHKSLVADDPQLGLYQLCIDRIEQLTGKGSSDVFRWIDVGAGGGELAAAMAQRFPRATGLALDLHDRPPLLEAHTTVEWRRCDLNDPDFAQSLEGVAGQGASADVVTAIAVWEHVTQPDVFARNLLRLLDRDSRPGLIYLQCPDYGSLARRWLGERWPYFTPGEHLFMPTARGAKRCLEVQWSEVAGKGGAEISARAIALPYSVRYAARRAGVPLALGRLIPRALRVPLPAGALEASVISR